MTSNFCSCPGPEFRCQLTAARHSGARRADALFGSPWALHAHSPTKTYPERKRFSVCESWKKGGKKKKKGRKPESAAPLKWSTPSRLTESPQLGKRALERRAQPAGPRAPPRRQPGAAHVPPGPALPTTSDQAFFFLTGSSLTGTTSSQW